MFYKNFLKINFPYIYFGLFFTILLINLYQLGGEFISSFFSNGSYNFYLPYINALSQIGFILVPVIIISNYNPLGRQELLRLKFHLDTKDLVIALLGLFGFELIATSWAVIKQAIIPEFFKKDYIELIRKPEELYLKLLGGQNIIDAIRALIIGAIIPAISEELLFRGLLQRSLEEKLKPSIAITLSGVIFSVIHFIPTNIVPLFIIGIFLGLVAYVTKSIMLPIILHFLNNAISIIGIYLIKQEETSVTNINQETIIFAIVFLFLGLGLIALSCIRLYKNHKINLHSNIQ